MKQEKIERINALARKSRTEGLTPEEKLEQQMLRQEYISAFRASMIQALDRVEIVEEDGRVRPLRPKNFGLPLS